MLPPGIADRLPADVFEQQARNRAKVRTDGWMYASELPAFDNAIEIYDRILSGRRVGNVEVLEDLGSALPPDSGSCNLTRHVRVRAHGTGSDPVEYDAVIKVTGHGVEPGEGTTLRRMAEAGVPTMHLLGDEIIQLPPVNGQVRETVVVITEYVPGQTLNTVPQAGTAIETVLDRARRLAPLHAANITPPPVRRTFAERMNLHFAETIPNLRANYVGSEASLSGIRRVLTALGNTPNARLIHGDPADVNFYAASDGRTLAFDPRGEVYGAPECDAGSIIAHHLDNYVRECGDTEATVAHVDAIIDAVVTDAATRGQELSPDALRAVVGVTMALWAGYGVPSPSRLNGINAGHRPDDQFADPDSLAVARVASQQRFAFGVELVQAFARNQRIVTDRSTWAL